MSPAEIQSICREAAISALRMDREAGVVTPKLLEQATARAMDP